MRRRRRRKSEGDEVCDSECAAPSVQGQMMPSRHPGGDLRPRRVRRRAAPGDGGLQPLQRMRRGGGGGRALGEEEEAREDRQALWAEEVARDAGGGGLAGKRREVRGEV